MLTVELQIQALADRIAGFTVDIPLRSFQEPWRTCWLALEGVAPSEAAQTLKIRLAGHSDYANILQQIFKTRPGHTLQFDSLLELSRHLKPIAWLWPGWLPRGMLTLLGAAPGAGKSFLALDLAWRITTGLPFPGSQIHPQQPGKVVYVDAEAVPQILNERAAGYQIDLSRLYCLLPDPAEMIDFGDPKYRDRLINMVATIRPELVIIDSLASIHSRGQNNVEDVRKLLSFLTQLAAAYQCGLLLIHHIRKPGNGQNIQMYDLSLSDLSGSGHIVAMARVVWGLHVVQEGPQPDPNGPRLLKMLKTNLGPYESALGFRFAPQPGAGVYLDWLSEAPQNYREPTQLERCAAWLLDLLQAQGALAPAEVIALGQAADFSRSLIYRARKHLAGQVVNTDGKQSPHNRWQIAAE